MTKTAIILGGSGFFGMHLARALSPSAEVSRVIIADLVPPRETLPKVEYIRADVRNELAIEAAGETEIYNFAAVHTTPGHEDWEYYVTNVAGAINACRLASRLGCRHLVFTSTMSVYGPQELLVDEDTPPVPVNAYGRSKLLAEQIHEDWQRTDVRNRLTIVRPAVVFGEGEHGNFTRLARLLRNRAFVFIGRRDTIKACAPVEELARSIAFMRSLDAPSTTYIFAYPERTTIEEITASFVQAAGLPEPKFVSPEWLMLAAAGVFEFLARIGIRTPIHRDRIRKLMQSTNVYPRRLVERGWTFHYPLTEALRRWYVASKFE